MAKPNDTIGPYTLISKLGRGAFGVVWLAEKRTAITTTRVAIKMPNDDDIDIEAVKQEASVWVHASGHPNVLPIIDADIYDEQIVIVSEYAPDGSLSKWLEDHNGKAPTTESAIEMTLGMLAGLEHLHKRGIIHRDLKPDNILLQNETPRLADFGIARILKTTSNSTVATGTPVYMPPEAFDGKRSEQTDIWSAGVILYQLLSGQLPFPQTDITSLLLAIVTHEPKPLPVAIPKELQQIVEKSLQKKPTERYKSASEMRQRLYSVNLSARFVNADLVKTVHLAKSDSLPLTVAATILLEKDSDTDSILPTQASPTQKSKKPDTKNDLPELAATQIVSEEFKISDLIKQKQNTARPLWMKSLVGLLVTIFILVVIFGGYKLNRHLQARSLPFYNLPDVALLDQLMKVDQQLDEAERIGNRTLVDKILADEYSSVSNVVDSTGKEVKTTTGKQDELKQIEENKNSSGGQIPITENAKLNNRSDDTATISYRRLYQEGYSGVYSIRYSITIGFVWRDNRWQITSEEGFPISK